MAGFGPTLTPYEYTYVLTDVERAQLAEVQPFPFFDVKDHEYRQRFGAFRNGEIYADPRARMVVGYGLPPGSLPNLLPVDPVYSPNDPRSQSPEVTPPDLYGTFPNELPIDTGPFAVTYYGVGFAMLGLMVKIVSVDGYVTEPSSVSSDSDSQMTARFDGGPTATNATPGIGTTVVLDGLGNPYTKEVAFTWL